MRKVIAALLMLVPLASCCSTYADPLAVYVRQKPNGTKEALVLYRQRTYY